MSSLKTLIEVSHVSYAYHTDHTILDDLSFTVKTGDYIGVIGPNGSGKSTLLKLLLGLLSLQKGAIRLFGQPVALFREWSEIGYVPQTGFQGEKNFPATVAEVIAVGLLPQAFFPSKKERQSMKKKIETVSEIVDIKHLLQRRIGELSGGEEQRAFIAQALVSDPELLVLDEPTAGVDLATEESFYGLLKELNEKYNKTIILVSHDLEALAHNAKTAICLNHEIIYSGPALGLHEERVRGAVFGSRGWHDDHDETL